MAHPLDGTDVVKFVQEEPEVLERLKAAEEFCWAFMLALSLGAFDDVEMGWRENLSKPLEAWSDLAVETGILQPGKEDEDAEGS